MRGSDITRKGEVRTRLGSKHSHAANGKSEVRGTFSLRGKRETRSGWTQVADAEKECKSDFREKSWKTVLIGHKSAMHRKGKVQAKASYTRRKGEERDGVCQKR